MSEVPPEQPASEEITSLGPPVDRVDRISSLRVPARLINLEDWARTWIALLLIGSFVAVIFVFVVFWMSNLADTDDVIRMFTTVLAVMAGLVGAVTGYYFRSREER